MMASSSGSPVSSKQGIFIPVRNRPISDKAQIAKQDRKWSTADEYRYLAAGLLRQQMPKLMKPALNQVSEGEVVYIGTIERNKVEKRTNRQKTNVNTMKNLAKEMGRMLSNTKSKGHTNELLQLFKNILNNFVTDKQQLSIGSGDESNLEYDMLSENKSRQQKDRFLLPELIKEPAKQRSQSVFPLQSQTMSIPATMISTSSKYRKLEPTKKARSNELNAFQDRKMSVVTTTKSKLKEPVISVNEGTKSNKLKRYYDKQNIKVFPLNNKTCKKPIDTGGIISKKTPTVVKQKSKDTKSMKQQNPSTNQQMKTIYENEQYDKSNSSVTTDIVIKETTSKRSVDCTEDGRTLLELKKPTLEKLVVDTEKVEHKLNNGKLQLCLESEKTIEPYVVESSETNQYESQQDNSLVQRLTSFWNRKLSVNRSEKSSCSNRSSTSSISTLYTPSISESNLDINIERSISAEKLSDEIISISVLNKKEHTNDDCSGIDVNGIYNTNEDSSQLPDIKLGLMDELIRVLRCKQDYQTAKHITSEGDNTNTNTSVIITQQQQQPDTNIKHYDDDDDDDDCPIINTDTTIYSNNIWTDEDADADTEEESIDSNDSNKGSNENNYQEEYNEETFEAIETCLMSNITVRNLDSISTDYDCNDNNSDTTYGEYQTHSDDNNNNNDGHDDDDDDNSNNNNKSKSLKQVSHNSNNTDDSIVNRSDKSDIYDTKYENDEGDLDLDKKIDQTEKTNAITDCKEASSLNDLTGDREQTITETITNVSDIIDNLRSLICTIESIPNEMKTMKMDLKSLPIPESIKQTLSLIVDTDINKIHESNERSLVCLNKLPVNTSTSFLHVNGPDAFTTKIRCKREGLLFTCYFPSTFTTPILENVISPTQLVLFPTRNDYVIPAMRLIRSLNTPPMFKQKTSDNAFTKSHSNYCHKTPGSCSYHSMQAAKDEKYTYVKRTMTKTHSTVFYLVNSNSKLSNETDSSILLKPYKKVVSFNNDFTMKPMKESDSTQNTEEEPYLSETHSTQESLQTISGDSTNSPTYHQQYNDSVVSYQAGNSNRNSAVIVDDVGGISVVDISPINQSHSTSVNNGRRHRFWLQTNIDDNNNAVRGLCGAGDYGRVTTTISVPCRRTSSMSVIVSGSINDSNSQSDVHLIESENHLTPPIGHCSIISKPCADVESLNHSTKQEINEERISDIDDCVMREQHQHRKQENAGTEETMTQTHSSGKSDMAGNYKKKNWDNECNRSSNMCIVTDKAIVVPSNKISQQNISKMKKACNQNYVLLCCNKRVPKKMRQMIVQNAINVKYSLNKLFENDPDLRRELLDIINLDSLCDKEKQLIAVCLILLKRNVCMMDTSLMEILKQLLRQQMNHTLDMLNEKAADMKNSLLLKFKSQTKVIISCKYRNMIKIVYTLLISLVLCFMMQKSFCGITIPVCFPW